MTPILRPVLALQDQPGMTAAIAAVVARSAGQVCATCGLELMGHAPESGWLGYDRHDWKPIPATPDMLDRARRLTKAAYAAR